MNQFAAFGLDLVLTVLVTLLLFVYLRLSLHRILIDLCGSELRARFWLAFSSLVLIGIPAASALGYRPEFSSADALFFDFTRQLGQNLISFLMALVGLGIVVGFFALVAPRAAKV